MRKTVLWLAVLLSAAAAAHAAEEKIRGVLEKTVKPGACAQITDALSDVYYITKTSEAEKLIADFVGKNIKVVITGTVETKEGAPPSYYFDLKAVEKYAPKLPPPAAEPASAAKTDAKAGKDKPDAAPVNTEPAAAKDK